VYHPSTRVLCFGIVLLLLASAFATIASAPAGLEFAETIESQIPFAQPGPPITYTLTVNVNPSSGGSVTKNPNATTYLSGTTVALTAVPASGYKFDNWTGDASGTSTSASVLMVANRTVNANFSQLPCYTLTTTIAPSGGGSVVANPTPNCNSGTQYSSGTVVTLTETPSSGYTFNAWSGDASGSTNATTVIMSGNKSVTAAFSAAAACYTLSTAVSPSGTGSVTVNTASNCSGGGYTSGTTVSITANPASGYSFINWSGGASGSSNSTTILMNANKSATATFAATPATCFTLSAAVSPLGTGSITINTPSNCSGGQYASGTTVSLTANPISGYSFSSWSGDASGSANPTTVTLTTNRSVTANFVGTGPTSTPLPVATITPYLSGVAVATSTVASVAPSSLPSTGGSPFVLLAAGLALVIIVIGARYLRRTSA
jgi:uncharacterized repeat protein (TIGR02543 family)